MYKNLKKYFAVFTLPTLIAFTIAILIPFIMGIYLSFTDFTTVIDAKWIGLGNYKYVFGGDSNFTHALWFTTKFAVVSVITINVLAFAMALALTKGFSGTNFFRTIFFMPNLIGGIVLGYIWQIIINGVLLKTVGADITYDASYGFWGLVVLMNWQQIGYMMIIYIAGIQNISEELIEAARIDGATSLQIVRRITIPLVMPALTICSFLTLTNSFKLFDQNLALTGGAPGTESSMLALDIFQTFYGRNGFSGVAQAKGVIFFLIVALIAFIQLYATSRREVEQ